MPKVVYVEDAGSEHAVEATVGESVMAAAVKNGVPGIIGECGGNASCGTCHVWVREEYAGLVGEPNDLEEDLLEMAVSEPRDREPSGDAPLPGQDSQPTARLRTGETRASSGHQRAADPDRPRNGHG